MIWARRIFVRNIGLVGELSEVRVQVIPLTERGNFLVFLRVTRAFRLDYNI